MKSFKTELKDLSIILILATIMGYVMCPECYLRWDYFWKSELIVVTIWLVMWYGNSSTSHLIDRYVTWLENPSKRFALGIAGSIVFSVTAILLLSLLFEFWLGISVGDGWSTIWITIGVTLFILLFMLSKEFLYSWRAVSIREEQMRNEMLASKYDVLKSQINPHFMFNSLNTLNSLIYRDQDLATKYVGQLSKVYRTVLTSAKDEVVTVEKELEILDSYIFLQSIRFEDKFKVNIELSEESRQMHIPPMVLQMLIENAIKHNELTSDNPLIIEVFDKEGLIYIQNKIVKKKVLPGDNSSTGLSNIIARYKAFSDIPVEVIDDGDLFVIKVPLLHLK